MMKRSNHIYIVLLSLVFSLFLIACGGSPETTSISSESQSEASEVVEEAAVEMVEEVEAETEEIAEPVEEEAIVETEMEAVEAVEADADMEEVEAAEAEPEAEESEAIVEESGAEMVAIVAPNDYDQIGQTGRPQFLNAYADWWSTWRANAPVVDGLKGTFEGRVDFFDLNVDNSAIEKLRQEKRINGRSHYILLAPDGETVLRQWFGPLDRNSMEAQVAALLEENGY